MFGSLFLWMGVFFGIFGTSADFGQWRYDVQETAEVDEIEIVDSFKPKPGLSYNGVRLIGYRYQFTTSENETFEGKAYAYKKEIRGPVQFIVSDPSKNRLPAYKSGVMPVSVALVFAAMPLLPLALILFGFWLNIRKIRGLRHGVKSHASVVDRKRIDGLFIKWNMGRGYNGTHGLYRYTLEFQTTEGETYQIKEYSTGHSEEFETEPKQLVYYNPANPRDVVVTSLLPGRPIVSKEYVSPTPIFDATVRIAPAAIMLALDITMLIVGLFVIPR